MFKGRFNVFRKSRDFNVRISPKTAWLVSSELTPQDVPAVQFWRPQVLWKWRCQPFFTCLGNSWTHHLNPWYLKTRHIVFIESGDKKFLNQFKVSAFCIPVKIEIRSFSECLIIWKVTVTGNIFQRNIVPMFPNSRDTYIFFRKRFSNIIDLTLWQIISWSCEQKNAQNQHYWSFLRKEALKKFFQQNLVRCWGKKIKKCSYGRRMTLSKASISSFSDCLCSS